MRSADLHRRLRRQLRAFFPPDGQPPTELFPFIEALNASYHAFDADRSLLERSLELSSQELFQANSDMRGVIQAFPDLFMWLSTDGTVLGCRGRTLDPHFRVLTGLVDQNLTGAQIPDLWALQDALKAFRRTGQATAVEYRVVTPNGEEFYEARLAAIGERQVLVIVRRTTERVLTARTEEQTVALLRSTLEATADGILVVGVEGNIVAVNRKFIRMWELPTNIISLPEQEALRFALPQIVDPDAFIARVQELYANPEQEGFDEVHLKNGHIFERYSTPFRIGAAYRGRVWSFRDVTQRRKAEAALREREEELRHAQKMEAIGKLAGGIAHDFNNILMAINGYAALALQDDRTVPETRSYLEEILKGGERASALIRQLLAFGRKQVLNPQVLNINSVLQGLDNMLRRVLGEDIRLEIQLAEDLGSVLADPVQMEQVLMNLVVNARDAMPDGGLIRMETINATLESDTKTGLVGGQFVRVSVSDTGTGMDQATRQRVFEPFFTTKPLGKGTGLGLSTVYGIVRQSGGDVRVDSELGGGTTFHVFVPRTEHQLPRPTPPRVELAPQGTGSTILLVEDEAQVRMLLRSILTQNGYGVLEAADGEQAIAVSSAFQGPIDLMLTDLIMPVMYGDVAYERLRPTRPRMKVLFMSGYSGGESRTRARDGESFIQKPAAPDELLAKIAGILGGSEPA